MTNKISFFVKKSELNKYKTKSIRSKARIAFIKLINKKMRKYECNCFLKSNWNFFSTKKSRIKWTGVFYCIECNNKFRTKLHKMKKYKKLICEISFVCFVFTL